MDASTILLTAIALLLAVGVWELRTTRRETTAALYWLAGRGPLEDVEPVDLLRPTAIRVPRAVAPCHDDHWQLAEGVACPRCKVVPWPTRKTRLS